MVGDNAIATGIDRGKSTAGEGLEYGKIRCKFLVPGSYTIEAAFVFPVVLGICFAILYSILFYHDRAILQSNLEEMLLLEAEGGKLNESERKEYLQKQLWLLGCQENEIKRGAFYIKGSAVATARLRIPILAFFLEENQSVSLSGKYPLIHPASYQRYRKNGKEKSDGKTGSG